MKIIRDSAREAQPTGFCQRQQRVHRNTDKCFNTGKNSIGCGTNRFVCKMQVVPSRAITRRRDTRIYLDSPRCVPVSNPVSYPLTLQEPFAAERLWNAVKFKGASHWHKGDVCSLHIIESHRISVGTVDREMIIKSLVNRRCYNRLPLLKRILMSLVAALNNIF